MSLELDLLPAVAIWRWQELDGVDRRLVDVFHVRTGGGELKVEHVDGAVAHLARAASESDRFVLVYDLTAAPSAFVSALPRVAAAGAALRAGFAEGAHKASVVVCPDAVTRTVVQSLISILPSTPAPVRVVSAAGAAGAAAGLVKREAAAASS